MSPIAHTLVPLPHLHTASIAVAVRGGPRFEAAGEGGLTHLLEHVLFRGAGAYPDVRALLGAFEELGEEPEAYTEEDALVLAASVDPGRVGDASRLLATVLLEPHLCDLEAERAVVLEERLERVDEDGRDCDPDDLLMALAFGAHPLGRPVLGLEREVRAHRREDLARWRERLVRRPNLAVALAGPIEVREVEGLLAPFEAIPAGPALELGAPPPPQDGPRVSLHRLTGSQVDVRIAFRGPGEAAPEHAALRLLADVLDGGATARVPQLVDAGLAYQAHAEVAAFPDVSLLQLGVTVAPAKTAGALEALFDLARGVAEAPLADELARARARRARRARAERDDARGLADDAARRLAWGLPSREAARAAEEAADEAAVLALARELVRPARASVLVLGELTRGQAAAVRRALRARELPA